jgi:hypothetical protein
LSGPAWLLAGGFVLGLFVGWPMLFLDFRSVVHEISFAMSFYGQFASTAAQNPFDLRPVWKYFSVLIPYATYPVLWLPIYLSTLYVLSRRSLWPTVFPLCFFAALYTYPMAKGYLINIARQVMFLLPVFCIFAGLAFADILPKLLRRRLLFAVVMTLISLLIIPTIIFDWAYGHAMERPDVRDLLRQNLTELSNMPSPVTVGVSDNGAYFYTVMPALFPLENQHTALLRVQRSFSTPADFLVIGFPRPLPENLGVFMIRRVESAGVFRFVKAYSHAPTILGKSFDLSHFPPDMTYPFPSILVFRKATKS